MAVTIWIRQHLTAEPDATPEDRATAEKWAEDWAAAWEAYGWRRSEFHKGACIDVTIGTQLEIGKGARYG